MTAIDNSASTMNLKQWRKHQAEKRELARKTQEVPAEVPAEIPAEAQQTENASIAKLLSTLPEDKRNEILDEYDNKGGNDIAWLRERVQPKEEKQQVDVSALEAEYKSRLAKIPQGSLWQINSLKREMRQRGLRSIH